MTRALSSGHVVQFYKPAINVDVTEHELCIIALLAVYFVGPPSIAPSFSDEQKQIAHTLQELFNAAPELYVSFFETPLQRAAVKVYHEKAVKHLDEYGTEGVSEAVEEWVRLEAARAEALVKEQHREEHMAVLTDLMLLADAKYQRPDA